MVDGATTSAGWNRYMYVHGNPVMYKDPTGHVVERWTNEVEVLGVVGTGYHHAFLVATPENQEAFKEYFTEENKESGKVFQTGGTEDKPIYSIIMRAGPNKLFNGQLDNEVNISKDHDRMSNGDITSYSKINNPIGKDTEADTDFIKNLIKNDETYMNNKTSRPEYEAFPDQRDYENNSNSYVRGLLESVGAKAVHPQNAIGEKLDMPGWDKPVNPALFKENLTNKCFLPK